MGSVWFRGYASTGGTAHGRKKKSAKFIGFENVVVFRV
jgi:hypothetical protein